MIIIAGTVDVDADRRDAALAAGKPHMEATRTQKGCLDYVWSADSLTSGRIYVYERADGKTVVSYSQPSAIFMAYGHEGLKAFGQALDGKFQAIVQSATK